MCGIAGAINLKLSRKSIKNVFELLKNRGPDDKGIYRDNFVSLIHTRLSIIDSNRKSRQPMKSPSGRYIISFNGEIYNFESIKSTLFNTTYFKTNSDTEVILKLYEKFGPSCLKYLNGMFAIAIWDSEENSLFLARDRLGVKPLFYSFEKNTFSFSSRLESIFAMKPLMERKIDKQALRYYLNAGFVPSPYSIYKGIKKLQPGEYLIFKSGKIKKTKYWDSNNYFCKLGSSSKNEDNSVNKLDSLLNDSISLRLISDHNTCSFLSGGIDSSLISYYLSILNKKYLETFSIGFSDTKFDESKYAKAVSSYLKINNSNEIMTENDFLNLIPIFFENFDEPFYDYSAFAFMKLSKVASRKFKVALSGDGADELFGGYHYYTLMYYVGKLHKFPLFIRLVISFILSQTKSKKLVWFAKILKMNSAVEAYSFIRSTSKDANLINNDFFKGTKDLLFLYKKKSQKFHKDISYEEFAMRIDIAYTLPDDYLQKIDIASMAFSLEVREPFLDKNLVEWALNLPINEKVNLFSRKILLKKLAFLKIPKTILDRKKMGFSLPIENWLRGKLKPWGEKLVNNKSAFRDLGIDHELFSKLWGIFQGGNSSSHTVIWNTLVLLQFYEKNFRKA